MSVQSSKLIEHKGIIKDINDKVIMVDLENISACGTCQAKHVCGVSDGENKTVEVLNTGGTYSIGDSVDVEIKESAGFKALFLGYLLPFLVLLISLAIFLQILKNELIAGALAVAMLIPYYLILYFFRERLKKTFTFALKARIKP